MRCSVGDHLPIISYDISRPKTFAVVVGAVLSTYDEVKAIPYQIGSYVQLLSCMYFDFL